MGKRIEELDQKWQSQGLGVEKTREFMRLMKEHAEARVFEFPDLASLGDEAEEACRNRYFLEAISLRMLLLDFFLRAYIVSRTGAPIEPYSKQDKMTFCPLVKRAHKHGLADDLAGRLLAFNNKRVSGVHHFLLGRGSYQEIRDAYRAADWLDGGIMEAMVPL